MHDDRVVPDLTVSDNVKTHGVAIGHRVQVALLVGVCLGLAYLAINSITSRLPYDVNAMTAWDRAIPFIPEWVWVYNLNIPMPLALILFIKQGDELMEVVAGYLVIFVVAGSLFLALPVHADELRAVIAHQPQTLSVALVDFYYNFDGIGNCLPSLHVAYSVYAGWWGLKLMPRWLGLPYALLGLAITVSTMTIKQHFIADVVSAILIVGIVYWLQRKRGLRLRDSMPKALVGFVTKT